MSRTKQNKVSKQIDALVIEATRIGLLEIERLARKALTTRGRAHRFVMGMGTVTFYDKNDRAIEDTEDYYDDDWRRRTRAAKVQRCIQDVIDFIDEHDRDLHLTGMPMRIDSPDAPTRTDW